LLFTGLKPLLDEINDINWISSLFIYPPEEPGGRVSQESVGIPLVTNCAPPLADFIQELLKKKQKHHSPIL
jgi:hypothetical protein